MGFPHGLPYYAIPPAPAPLPLPSPPPPPPPPPLDCMKTWLYKWCVQRSQYSFNNNNNSTSKWKTKTMEHLIEQLQGETGASTTLGVLTQGRSPDSKFAGAKNFEVIFES